jgi:hypothetical protein
MAAEYDKDKNILKIYFNPSTIETIDAAMLRYIQNLNLSADTNKGWSSVPVIWAGSERGFQSKRDIEIRDERGMLKYPLITVMRKSIDKNLAKRAAFHGNVPEVSDEQGGSLSTHRVIHQEKTKNFARNAAFNLTGDPNRRMINNKIVYRTVSAPMPVNVIVNYDIMIRTEYLQQMYDLMIPFITKPGTVNAIMIHDEDHRYEAFIGSNINQTSNITNYGAEERRFDTTIPIQVVGYLIGEGKNRERPYYAIRENAVEVKIPRERISLSEVPEHEYGKYYGLTGAPSGFSSRRSPISRLLSNVPAIGAGGAGGGGGLGGDIDVSDFLRVGNPNIVTKDQLEQAIENLNIVQNITNNTINSVFAFREILKDSGNLPPADGVSLSTDNKIKLNSETVFKNRILQAPGLGHEYTIVNNQTIVFNNPLDILDDVYITYLKED